MSTRPVENTPAQTSYTRFFNSPVCIGTAVVASAIGLAYILQSSTCFTPAPETCEAILSNYDRDWFFTSASDDKFLTCFKEQQTAIGAGSVEECKNALNHFTPPVSPFSRIVEEMGGADPFCNLIDKQFQNSLQVDTDKNSHLTTLQNHVNSMYAEENYPAISRVVDSQSIQLGIALKTSVTTTHRNSFGEVVYLDVNKPSITEDVPHGTIYFQGRANPISRWQVASCAALKPTCYFREVRDLESRDIVDLRRLMAGDTICHTDSFYIETCTKLL